MPPVSALTALTAVNEYVAKAVQLAADVPRLAELRAGLRQRMLQVAPAPLLAADRPASRLPVSATHPDFGLPLSSHPAALLQSPLCDAPTFVRQLEDVYRRLWRRWLEQRRREAVSSAAEETSDDPLVRCTDA